MNINDGGGASKIAEDTGLPLAEVKAFIKAEEEMYPGVVALHERWIEEVESNRYASDKRTYGGLPARKSHYTSITGKRYGFIEQDTPKTIQLFAGYKEALRNNPDLSYNQFKLYGKPKLTGFKPTQIKNYQTQGESGTIIYLILGELYNKIHSDAILSKLCLLINTVHDSVMFDVHKGVINKSKEVIKSVFDSTPKLFKDIFGVEFNLPIKCEIEVGDTWGTKK